MTDHAAQITRLRHQLKRKDDAITDLNTIIAKLRADRQLVVVKGPFVGRAVKSTSCIKGQHRKCGRHAHVFGRRVWCGCTCHLEPEPADGEGD